VILEGKTMTINFDIKNRFSGEVQFTAKIECEESATFGLKVGLAAKWAIKNHTVLRGAVLTDAVLTDADLTDADLRGAVLRGAVLNDKQLRNYKHDFWGILIQFKDEIPALREHIIEGKIDGSVYSATCACLMGTIANIKDCEVDDLPKDSGSYIESWFMMIKPGDTPENNFASKKSLEWLDEFTALLNDKEKQ